MNPLTQPIQILSDDSTPVYASTSNGGFLGDDGFLSKFGEVALDLAGLYGDYDLKRTQIEASADRPDPQIEASQARAGILPSYSDFPAKELLVGGAIVAGVSVLAIAAIAIATRKG